jgi:CCR4-NOT transcription complex subunit 4
MGGEGFSKNQQTSFPRYANNPDFSKNLEETAASHPVSSNSPSITHATTHHQPILNAVPLPTTASWASANKTPQPALDRNDSSSTLADASAFPTLAEATTLQQQLQQQQLQQQQQRHKQRQQQFSDEFNLEVCTSSFVDETMNFLNSLNNSISYKIKPSSYDDTSYPLLFAYDKNSVPSTTPRSQPRNFNLRLIESLISKPLQAPSIPQLQGQVGAGAQHLPPQIPQSQFAKAQQDISDLQQQQQQQALLQQQLLQQQIIQQQIQQAQQQQLKTGTPNPPPPPGLFNPNDLNIPQGQAGQQLPQSQAHNGPSVSQGGAASELLSHLMNGKKISA